MVAAEDGAEAEVEVESGTEVELEGGIALAEVGLDGVDGDEKGVVVGIVDSEDTDAEELNLVVVDKTVAAKAG